MTPIDGTLVANDSPWRIPPYAREMVWVRQGDHAAQARGERGAFSVAASDEPLVLVWGAADGSPLAVWPPPEPGAPFVAGWNGTARIGGFVERLHVQETHALDLVIAEIDGAPLAPDYRRLPTLAEMRAAPFRRLPEPDLASTTRYPYFVLAPVDSVLAEYLHHAMVSELAVNCFAALGSQEGDWHTLVGMPLLLESLTLLAPGYRARLS